MFTWHGCTIELDGVSEVAYVADEVNFSSLIGISSGRLRGFMFLHLR